MIDYEKIAKIMTWDKFEGESWKDVFNRIGSTNGFTTLFLISKI